MNNIYFSKSGDGHRNLAADEYFLEQYRTGAYTGVTLYFYVNSNAVIIGRNQNALRECDEARMREEGVQLVRRHTGGGAVYHDSGNLNFSFITNEKLYDKERQNGVILSALHSLGIEAEVTGRNDLTLEGRKFSGCAYAVSGVARGMHGTLLVNTDMGRLSRYLRPSRKKLEAKGITSVRSRVMNLSEAAPVTVEQLKNAIAEAFRREYGECRELELDAEALREIDRLTEKQRSWEWVAGSAPAFDISLEDRFSFGELQLHLRIRNGIVENASAFTDALDTALPGRLAGLITGARYSPQAMRAALEPGGSEAVEIAQRFFAEDHMDTENKAEQARITLHSIPELALHEKKTKAFIKEFLRENTTLEVHDEGAWIYAVHREGAERTVAVRADFDAVPTAEGAGHLCGHNGHTAALLDLALRLEGKSIGKNAVLLFQPAEETGEGAPICCALFEKERIDAVLGAHNIPGAPMGRVLLKNGTFACASCGVEIELKGRPTHAAYPENGVNPTAQIARLALELPAEAERLSQKYGCMTLATIVGMRTGEKAFGVAASEGRLWATLRSEDEKAFTELVNFARSYAGTNDSDERTTVSDERLKAEFNVFDPFPATVNDPGLLARAEKTLQSAGIPYEYVSEPFRWSEDFGHYGAHAPACFIGIGSGECTAPLHTAGYEYPAGLVHRTGGIFMELIKGL